MEDIVFKYSGLFQNVEIRIYNSSKDGNRMITADADIKLPILKKQYTVSTKYKGDSWEWDEHFPIIEKGGDVWSVKRTPAHDDVLDPLTFFMELHMNEWSGDTVQLLLGKKVVQLDVMNLKNGHQVKRRDKDQSLIARQDHKGVAALEIPIPVLGSISIKRV